MPVKDFFGNLKVGDRFIIPSMLSAFIKTSENFAMDEISHRLYRLESTLYIVRCQQEVGEIPLFVLSAATSKIISLDVNV